MNALDDRLRAALHDLDDRATAHTARPRSAGQATPIKAHRRHRWLVPALAAAAVAAMLVGAAIAFRPLATPTPAPPATQGPATPTATPSTTPTRAATVPPSQSAAEARRDAVYPQIAGMPLSDRTARIADDAEPVATQEGVWQLGHPDVSRFESPDDGCVEQLPGAPSYRLCGSSYAEVQLLSADRSRLLRAFPLPELAADWIEVTPDAVYCGRSGDGAVPESMLCRIDRDGFGLTGRLYACDGPDCAPWEADAVATWPGTWSQGTDPISGGFDGIQFTGQDLLVTGPTGDVTVIVDPVTLRER